MYRATVFSFAILLIVVIGISNSAVPVKRCGTTEGLLNRYKRYLLNRGGQTTRNVTYRVSQYTAQLSKADVDRTLRRAFDIWTEHVNLNFTQLSPTEKVDIDVRFGTGEHGDGYPFDGPGGVLAHATSQFVHFDDDEQWTVDQNGQGIKMLSVAVHEIGHSLGLSHSDIRDAIMYPTYHPDGAYKLHEDDINGIQHVYKKKKDPSKFNLNLCVDPEIDAAFNGNNGKIFILKGDYYYELVGTSVVDGPGLIGDRWRGLPGDIDDAFTQKGKTFFFKAGYYWRFTGNSMDPGYPRRLASYYSEIPNYVNSAIVWDKDNRVYFFKQDKYYRMNEFNERYTEVHEGKISEWKGIPNNTDAAISHQGLIYFFKDHSYYYFDRNQGFGPYKTTDTWFDCKK